MTLYDMHFCVSVRFVCLFVFQTVLPDVMHSRSCLCSKDRCNSRVHVIISAFETSATTSQPLMVSMHNLLWDREQNLQTSNGFKSFSVPFIVLLICLLLVLMIAIVVTRIYQFRRKVQSYSYGQLNDNLSVDEA